LVAGLGSRGIVEKADHSTPDIEGGHVMLRYLLALIAAFVLLTATLIPDDAYARGGRGGGGGGMRAGGFHGGGYRGGGMHAGRIHGGGRHYAGGPRPSHPIAGRPGRPGYPIAGRPGRPIAGYPGGGYYPRYGYRGAAYGAAVGAAAVGAYGYYNNNGCYQDTYGNWVCPNQYPY
jgi:hypothetical protein